VNAVPRQDVAPGAERAVGELGQRSDQPAAHCSTMNASTRACTARPRAGGAGELRQWPKLRAGAPCYGFR
jgi:hypothetical protein